MRLHRLDNPVRNYAWGSRTTIARLRGRPVPSAEPEAEVWIGAHPAAPSGIAAGTDLLTAIEADPPALLGPGHDSLPFLLKILAVDGPLSIQVHPDSGQAERGFAREEALGLPRDDPGRGYRDASPKPELLCAVTPFDVLCGFREPQEAARLLRGTGGTRLRRVADVLERGGIQEAFALLGSWPAADRPALAAEAGGGSEAAHRAAAEIAARHPGDPGCAASLLLNLVTLEPGQAVYTAPRTVHAYLRGTGVEVMAASDNVLRGGLTSKHVDRDEFAAVAEFVPTRPEIVEPSESSTGEDPYPAPARQFRLTRLGRRRLVRVEAPGPSVVLCVEGSIRVARGESVELLGPGEALFVPYEGGGLSVETEGLGFRASLPTVPARPGAA